MKKRIFTITTIVFSLLFTSCLADYLNEKFGFTAPIYINYSSPYGNPPKRKQVTSGTTLTEEDLPKLYINADEYENEFLGWFLDNKYTNPAYPGFIIEKSITLYAQWKYDYKAATDTQGLYKVEFSFFDPDSGTTNFEYHSEYDMYFNNSEFAMNYTRPFEGYEYIPGADHTYTYDDYSNDTYRPVTVYVKRYYKTHISAHSFYSIGYYLPDYEGFTYNIYITDYAPAFALNVSPPSTNLHLEDCVGLTVIPESAFKECTWLKEIYLPYTINTIDESAFKDCSMLSHVYIPASGNLKTIGEAAFSHCSSLKEIELPDSVETIGSSATGYSFEYCSSLTSIKIPKNSNLTSIKSGTFLSCTNLTSVYIPINIKRIDSTAFYETNLSVVYYEGTEEQRNSSTFVIQDDTIQKDEVRWEYNQVW